ncbi:uncharacterized protein LOC144925288 [Branchiostoma floridae x Branchiostoma belcheri]
MRFLLALAITLGVAMVTSTGQRTRQPFQGNNCQDLPNGNYPDLDDCTKFHMCSRGLASRVSCPGNLRFDIKTLQCELPEFATCAGTYGDGKASTSQQSVRNAHSRSGVFMSAPAADASGSDCLDWTDWFDRDDPKTPPVHWASGDWEDIEAIRRRYGKDAVCDKPTDIKYRLVDETKRNDPTFPKEFITYKDTIVGFACISSEQDDKMCEDYEVSFCCE